MAQVFLEKSQRVAAMGDVSALASGSYPSHLLRHGLHVHALALLYLAEAGPKRSAAMLVEQALIFGLKGVGGNSPGYAGLVITHIGMQFLIPKVPYPRAPNACIFPS